MSAERMSRRHFLQWASVLGGGALLAACKPQVEVVKETVAVPVQATTIVETEKVVTATPVASPEGDITIWTYPATENDPVLVYEPLTIKFNEVYPGIRATIDVQPWDGRREKLYTAVAAGAPPDIWWADSDTLLAYAAKDVALPLNDVVEPELLSDYDEQTLAMGTDNGKLLILANIIKCAGPSHNGKLIEECGIEPAVGVATWDELLALGETAKSKGYYLDAIDTFDWQIWLLWLRSANGTVYTEDGTKTTMREEPAKAVLSTWVTLFQEGFVPKEGAVGTAEASGAVPNYYGEQKQVTKWRSGEGDCVLVPRQVPGFQYMESPPRQRTKDQKPCSGYAAMRGWAITKLSKQKDAALTWLKYNIRPEMIGQFCSFAKQIPPGAESKKFWVADDCIIEHVRAHEPYLWYNQDSYTLWQESKVVCAPHFQAAVLGVETVEEALDAMATELEALLAQSQA